MLRAAAARRDALGTARRDHGAHRGPLPGPRGGALQRRLPVGQVTRNGRTRTLVGTTIYARSRRARDRHPGRRNRRARRIAGARSLRGAQGRLRQHLHLRRARRSLDASTPCSSRTSTRPSARRSNPAPGANPLRAARRAPACSRARRCRKARPSRVSRWVPRPELESAPPSTTTAPKPGGQTAAGAGRGPRSSPSRKAQTRSTFTRSSSGAQVIAGTVLGHVGEPSAG